MIEDVLRIGPELNANALPPRNCERLGRLEIERIDPWTPETVPSHVTPGSRRRLKECRRIKPFVATGPAGWPPTHSGVPVWKRLARKRIVGLIAIDSEGISGLEKNGTCNLPAPHHLAEQTPACHEWVPLSRRRLINR